MTLHELHEFASTIRVKIDAEEEEGAQGFEEQRGNLAYSVFYSEVLQGRIVGDKDARNATKERIQMMSSEDWQWLKGKCELEKT